MLENWSNNNILEVLKTTKDQCNATLNEVWKTLNFQSVEQSIDASQEWEFPKKFTFKWYDFILHKNVFSPIHFKWSSIYVEYLL